MPEGLNGFVRVAQNKIRVNVIGTDKVSTFKTAEVGGMILLHEQDAAALVNNSRKLEKCRADLKAAQAELDALKNAPGNGPD